MTDLLKNSIFFKTPKFVKVSINQKHPRPTDYPKVHYFVADINHEGLAVPVLQTFHKFLTKIIQFLDVHLRNL